MSDCKEIWDEQGNWNIVQISENIKRFLKLWGYFEGIIILQEMSLVFKDASRGVQGKNVCDLKYFSKGRKREAKGRRKDRKKKKKTEREKERKAKC